VRAFHPPGGAKLEGADGTYADEQYLVF